LHLWRQQQKIVVYEAVHLSLVMMALHILCPENPCPRQLSSEAPPPPREVFEQVEHPFPSFVVCTFPLQSDMGVSELAFVDVNFAEKRATFLQSAAQKMEAVSNPAVTL
jgi:hypothetical protein